MDMDKDVASAIVLERCNCYDSALEAAKKALIKEELPEDQMQATRDVIKSLGRLYYKQQCLEKILECYHLLQELAPDQETGGEPGKTSVSFELNNDLYDILQAVQESPDNEDKDRSQLLSEAVTLLILKYSSSRQVKELILDKAGSIFS